MKTKGLIKDQLVSSLLCSPKDYFNEMVDDGFSKKNLKKTPAVKDYVVGILEHYLDANNLFDAQKTTLAEMFLIANQSEGTRKIEILKKLGDKSLYISGFFGDSLSRKMVDIDYYVDMGGAAYASLAECSREDTTARVYKTISKQFVDFVDVLTYISQKSMLQTDQNILRLYERYIRTGSTLARDQLIEIGVLTVSSDQMKLVRQDDVD